MTLPKGSVNSEPTRSAPPDLPRISGERTA
jgi:hypothetical protein